LENVTGRPVIGYRNHYLRFSVPKTWQLLSEAGFKYDTTFGFPDVVGFRNGMCHPFMPYDLHRMKDIDIMEIPLAIMDGTLFGMSKSYDEALSIAKRLIDTVRLHNGVLVLNWHTNSFNCPFRGEWPKAYESIIKYASEQNAWFTNGEGIWRLFG